jgi:hypothetical protein
METLNYQTFNAPRYTSIGNLGYKLAEKYELDYLLQSLYFYLD